MSESPYYNTFGLLSFQVDNNKFLGFENFIITDANNENSINSNQIFGAANAHQPEQNDIIEVAPIVEQEPNQIFEYREHISYWVKVNDETGLFEVCRTIGVLDQTDIDEMFAGPFDDESDAQEIVKSLNRDGDDY